RAVEKIRAEPFDLVLLDIMMPEMDGYQVLAEMMGDPALKHVPVIMISAVTEMESVVKCIEMGATDYLPKPFNPVLLKARVGAALFMALFRSLLRATATAESKVPGADIAADLLRTVRLTNDYIARTHGRSCMFATLFFGALDPATGSLVYVNGGHEAPVLFGAGGIGTRLSPTGPAVGMMPNAVFEAGRAIIGPGESLLAFTDGVTDARGESGRYGEKRLLAALDPAVPAASLLDTIEKSVLDHAGGGDQTDDITLLAVRRL